jgi:hypothetical protein
MNELVPSSLVDLVANDSFLTKDQLTRSAADGDPCHKSTSRSGGHYLRELNVLFVSARPFSIPILSQWLIDQRMNGMQANKTISALIHSMSILLEKGRRFD